MKTVMFLTGSGTLFSVQIVSERENVYLDAKVLWGTLQVGLSDNERQNTISLTTLSRTMQDFSVVTEKKRGKKISNRLKPHDR